MSAEDTESELQVRMRNLGYELLAVAREMKAANGDMFDDVNDLTFRMNSIAVILFGYAPQKLPEIGNSSGRRETLFH